MTEPFAIPVRDAVLQQLFAQPALIGWQDRRTDDYQYLGHLSIEKHSRSLLTFCAKQDAEKLLIHFHLPLKVRSSNKKAVRHMHLVVPVESLRLGIEGLSVQETRPHTRLELERDGLRSGDLLVRVNLEITTRAYALMPLASRPPQRLLSGMPAQLLRHLRSLTEADAINVYLRQGPILAQLFGLSKRLKRGDMATPSIDIELMYGREFRGGKNSWGHYACEESGPSVATCNPLVDDDTLSSGQVATIGQNDIWKSPPARTPPLFKEVSPHPSEASSEATRIGWRVALEPSSEPRRFVDTVPQKRTNLPNGRERQDGHVSPGVLEVTQSRSRSLREMVSCGGTTEEFSTLREIVSQSMSVYSLSQQGSVIEEDSSSVECSRAELDAIRLSNAVADFLRARSSRLDPSGLAPSYLHTPHLFLELKEWIHLAWNYDISAHETFRSQLLTLGAAVREYNQPLFDATMRECQQRSLSRARGTTRSDATPANQVYRLLEWLDTRICRDAGKLMMPLLVDLKLAAEKVETLELSQVADMVKARKEWNDKLAGAYAAVFRAFGGLV